MKIVRNSFVLLLIFISSILLVACTNQTPANTTSNTTTNSTTNTTFKPSNTIMTKHIDLTDLNYKNIQAGYFNDTLDILTVKYENYCIFMIINKNGDILYQKTMKEILFTNGLSVNYEDESGLHLSWFNENGELIKTIDNVKVYKTKFEKDYFFYYVLNTKELHAYNNEGEEMWQFMHPNLSEISYVDNNGNTYIKLTKDPNYYSSNIIGIMKINTKGEKQYINIPELKENNYYYTLINETGMCFYKQKGKSFLWTNLNGEMIFLKSFEQLVSYKTFNDQIKLYYKDIDGYYYEILEANGAVINKIGPFISNSSDEYFFSDEPPVLNDILNSTIFTLDKNNQIISYSPIKSMFIFQGKFSLFFVEDHQNLKVYQSGEIEPFIIESIDSEFITMTPDFGVLFKKVNGKVVKYDRLGNIQFDKEFLGTFEHIDNQGNIISYQVIENEITFYLYDKELNLQSEFKYKIKGVKEGINEVGTIDNQTVYLTVQDNVLKVHEVNTLIIYKGDEILLNKRILATSSDEHSTNYFLEAENGIDIINIKDNSVFYY